MNKKIISVILTLIIFSFTLTAVYAEEKEVCLFDAAGILSEADGEEINDKLSEAGEKNGYYLLIVTVDSFEGMSSSQVAEEWNDKLDLARRDTVMMLISMEENNRKCWIFPYGEGKDAFTDAGMDYILDEVILYFGDDEFYSGCNEFITLCDDFIEQAKSGKPYDSSNLPKEPFDIMLSVAVSVIVGFVIAFIVTSAMKGKLKSVRSKAKADDYLKHDSLAVSNSRDYFLYRTVTKTKKESSSSSTSSRSSSSGESSGRGKSF